MTNNPKAIHLAPLPGTSEWKTIVGRYQKPCVARGVWQIINTFLPYAGLWCLMFLSLKVSIWLAVPLAVLAGGFLIRIFIIFHDCCHGSFLKSPRTNDVLGFIAGVLSFTPYHHWRWEHALHHATSGDLDRRGTGDLWTLTVNEYLEATFWKRFGYRLARNPVVLFILAPLGLFLVKYRIPSSKAPRRERRSVHLTNLMIAALATGLAFVFGLKAYLVLQLIVLFTAGSAGVWLFYVQHQFDGAYWERRDDWDYTAAALQGSSFYKLPRVLQWFSGNIGFHHVHHLSPRIPNYYLEKCHKSEPLFHRVRPVTFWSAFRSLTFRLWDEQRHQLVGFCHLRDLRR